MISMDLNASPLPEEDEEDKIVKHLEEVTEEEHIETAVETLRREREERRRRLKREHPDEGRRRVVEPPNNDYVSQNRNQRSCDRKLPPGWLDCPAHGNAIGVIVPSKVPLGENFSDVIVPGKRYSLRQVLHQQRALGRELGMVIDLTNTTRYYPPSDWKKQGIKHVKIACKGRDAVPDNEAVNNFVYEVLQFVSRQKHSKKYVLVHCTHGHNRTGFMIIHYLMRSQSYSVTEALDIFVNARTPGIYKEDYIDSLYKFYHEERPETITCPPTPEWKRSSDFDLNGDAMQDEDDIGGIEDPLHENVMENEVMTIDDVLGDAIPYHQQDAMRQFCLHSLKMPPSKGNPHFPGSHPVSLDRENLQLLRQRYYYATWKADGTRYMMLITWDGCYLVDRNFNFRRVQMRFPLKQSNEAHSFGTHNLTLLDGEMVIDTLPTKELARRYLIYDLMVLNGKSVVELPFSERWRLIEKEVVEPRNFERQNIQRSRNPYYRYEMEPFRVRRKDFYLLCTVPKLLKEFIPKLSHAADGLIFQGWDDPYVPRTHEGLLKWKYPEMNSIDFLLEVGDDDSQQLYIFQKGRKKLLEGDRVVFKDVSDVSAYSGKIIECNWEWDDHCWACMRVRTDKTIPNDISTYRKVVRSINDNITEEVVLNEIQEIVSLPMYADRINSDKRGHGRRR